MFITNIQPFWASQSSLTALVPASNVWLDFAKDVNALPYVVFSQVGSKYKWQTSGSDITITKIMLTAYDSTLSSVCAIGDAIKNAFQNAHIGATTGACSPVGGFGAFLVNEIVRQEVQSAYSCTLIFESWENENF